MENGRSIFQCAVQNAASIAAGCDLITAETFLSEVAAVVEAMPALGDTNTSLIFKAALG